MKKGSIIAMIVAGVLIVSGAFLTVMGLSFAKSRPKESTMRQMEVLVVETFENIHINTQDCDVSFVPYNGTADARVVLWKQERVSHSVYVEDGTLKIEMNDMRNWTDHIQVFDIFSTSEKMKMTVYLPETAYDSVYIQTNTGDIQTPSPLRVKQIQLRSDTGDVYCDSRAADSLDCMTSTGDITVRSGDYGRLKLHSSTGDIKLSGVTGTEVHLKSSTGEMEAQNVKVQVFSCSNNTGEVELEGVLAEEYLQIRTSTGDVEIESCDAVRVDIETGTGDVQGHFLTPKWFSAHSDTGNVSVPPNNTPEGGECRIETDTGDIKFE